MNRLHLLCLLITGLCYPVRTDTTESDDFAPTVTSESSTSKPKIPKPPGGCFLPEHPRHGAYNSTLCHPSDQRPACQNIPGTPVPAQWQLMYSCHDGYSLTTDGSEYSVCDRSIWLNLLDCIRYCPPLDSHAMDIRCSLDERVVACDRPMRAKTIATAKCTDEFKNTTLKCQDNGTWSQELFNCTPASSSTSNDKPDKEDRRFNLGCKLPALPEKGSYTSLSCRHVDQNRTACKEGRPGTRVPHSWLLGYTCNEGYVLTSKQTTFSVCDNGTWVIPLDCVPSSSLSNNQSAKEGSSFDLGCRLPEYPEEGIYDSPVCGRENTNDACSGRPGDVVPHRWVIKYTCFEGHILTSNLTQFSVCDNGTWAIPLDCVPKSTYTSTGGIFQHVSWRRRARQTSCRRNEYFCGIGQCISSAKRCDGRIDCYDGSDETSSICNDKSCPPGSFQCAYGACIADKLKCDGKPDCSDGSDERNCSGTVASAFCRKGRFQCENKECIDVNNICDGTKDCVDGSDETSALCQLLNCPPGFSQCEYGGCLDSSAFCDGREDCPDGFDEHEDQCGKTPVTQAAPVPLPASLNIVKGCVLPDYPKNGNYESTQCLPGDRQPSCQNKPGTAVPSSWVLKYTCDPKYNLSSTESEFSVCTNGLWNIDHQCIRLCQPLASLSLDITCIYEGKVVSCDHPMKPGTTARTKCRQHYRQPFSSSPYYELTCLDKGEWNYRLTYCVPECGASLKTNPITPLIKDGTPTKQGDFPWLAALFMNVSGRWDQQCGGTLITPHIVLTAAHCLVDRLQDRRNPEDVKVGLGKYYRDYYKYENSSQISDVREVLIPTKYTGPTSYYSLDIGLLDLTVSIQVTAFIMPACVDWEPVNKLKSGDVGIVAGWGKTEDKLASDVVLSTQLAYVSLVDCFRELGSILRGYLTSDKFCGKKKKDGGHVGQGDSGGGLTFIRDRQHFIQGIVSTNVLDAGQVSLFTDLSNEQHISWVNKQRARLERHHFET